MPRHYSISLLEPLFTGSTEHGDESHSSIFYEIYVRMEKDKVLESITLEVTESDTIQNVKNKIEDRKGISVDSQELLFAEEKLEDQYTLSHYKIIAGSTLTLHKRSSSRSRCTVS